MTRFQRWSFVAVVAFPLLPCWIMGGWELALVWMGFPLFAAWIMAVFPYEEQGKEQRCEDEQRNYTAE